MNKEVEVITRKPCSKCRSGQTYLRISTMERICRMCGNIEKTKIEVKNGKD